jgi:hypothetical protein
VSLEPPEQRDATLLVEASSERRHSRSSEGLASGAWEGLVAAGFADAAGVPITTRGPL